MKRPVKQKTAIPVDQTPRGGGTGTAAGGTGPILRRPGDQRTGNNGPLERCTCCLFGPSSLPPCSVQASCLHWTTGRLVDASLDGKRAAPAQDVPTVANLTCQPAICYCSFKAIQSPVYRSVTLVGVSSRVRSPRVFVVTTEGQQR